MEFNFGKRNYQLMILGVVLIMCGYILMSGGKSVFKYGNECK
ncbi:DUF3098 domain-containing protein [bacterium]|nr:DUF3098 domain-containing protein [bacterium]